MRHYIERDESAMKASSGGEREYVNKSDERKVGTSELLCIFYVIFVMLFGREIEVRE